MADLNDLTQNVNIWDDAKSKSVTVTTDGSKERLDVDIPIGAVCTCSSTSTPLGSGGVFTGDWADVLAFAHISIQVYSNVASATDGMEVQWSVDESTVLDSDKFTIPADTAKVFTFGCQARYYRVKYTNGSTAQTTFVVNSILKRVYQKASSHRVSENISNQDDAELVKAVLTGEDSDGAFHNIQTIEDVHGYERLAVSTRPLGEVDTGNSTTTPLTGSGVYTGTWHDVIDAIHIAVLITANVASATDGVEVQWSTDGINVIDEDKFTLAAGSTKIWTFGPHTKYYRVKYTNGASAQSTFEISSIIKTAYQKSSSHRVEETISNQDDAELVKAVLTGEDSNGVFQNVKTDSDGNLLATAPEVTSNSLTSFTDTTYASASTWYTVLNITSTKGKLTQQVMRFDSDKFTVRLTIDGTVVWSIYIKDIVDILKLDDVLSAGINLNSYDTGKAYYDQNNYSFTDSCKVEVQCTDAGKKSRGYLFLWEERV